MSRKLCASVLGLGCVIVVVGFAQDPPGGGDPSTPEPYDAEPRMTASISPGFTSVNEGSYAVATIATFEKDTYRKVKAPPQTGYDYIQVPFQPIPSKVKTESSTSPCVITLSGQDFNAGTWNYTVSRQTMNVAATILRVDTFSVEDVNSGFLVDSPALLLQQQVEIKDVP